MSSITTVDKIIHEPARLNIIAHLYVVDSADFLFLMRQTNLTFGNLSSHMSKLEDAGYVEIIKEFVGKKPHTMLRLTKKGRIAFEEYRKKMKQFFDDMPD
ncbi:MAG: transcriptional regulator [Thermoplasmata archaeon M8B2D]|nr:MAG: transcriptional regulator [Thermoplasmata archaeon M8B2D]